MGAPSYDLATSGFREFARFGSALQQQAVARDPLSGVLDGDNLVFFTNYRPLLTSGSAAVYVGGVQVGALADYDTGEIVLDHPPATQPVASYTFTPYTSTQILDFLIAGLDELELWWTRGLQLVDAQGAPATPSSPQLLVADEQGQDPVCGTTTFSASRAQIGLYLACTEYRYLKVIHNFKAQSAYMWRETVRGMTVDQTRVPANLLADLSLLQADLKRALAQAQRQASGAGVYGAYISSPATLDYMGNLEWQTDSKEQDYRSVQFGYHIPLRRL